LADDDATVRAAAADAAGRLVDTESIEQLLRLASDSDGPVRLCSFAALERLDEPRAVSQAVAALADRQVTAQALKYLTRFGSREHASAVVNAAKHDPSAEVLAAAIAALSAWRQRSDVPERSTLDQAIADVQGAAGVVMFWERSDPGSFASTVIASGVSGRVQLPLVASGTPVTALARTFIHVDESTPVEFLASAGGKFQIWLNGESIFHREQNEPFRLDSERCSATLAKGDNRLLVSVTPSSDRAEFHIRFRRKSSKAEHERLIQAALARAGNPERGRAHFLNAEKSLCLKCHRADEQGQKIGPELSGLGNRFSKVYVIESILEPSRTIGPAFGSLTVLLDNGQTLSGLRTAETATHLTIADQQGQLHVLDKQQIEEQQPSPVSIMPEGLEKRLSEAEFVDLIAYLMSLKGD
jgi:putative heme-binding domain-containing protein